MKTGSESENIIPTVIKKADRKKSDLSVSKKTTPKNYDLMNLIVTKGSLKPPLVAWVKPCY